MGTTALSSLKTVCLLWGQTEETALLQETWEIFQQNNPLVSKTLLSSSLMLARHQWLGNITKQKVPGRPIRGLLYEQGQSLPSVPAESENSVLNFVLLNAISLCTHPLTHGKGQTSNCCSRGCLMCKALKLVLQRDYTRLKNMKGYKKGLQCNIT